MSRERCDERANLKIKPQRKQKNEERIFHWTKTNKNSVLGDILIFLNEINLLQPPIGLSRDRIQSEFNVLRREKRSIRLAVFRCSSESTTLNESTLRRLSSLTSNDLMNFSNENRKSTLTNRDSGFIDSDGKRKRSFSLIESNSTNKQFTRTSRRHSSCSLHPSATVDRVSSYRENLTSENLVSFYFCNSTNINGWSIKIELSEKIYVVWRRFKRVMISSEDSINFLFLKIVFVRNGLSDEWSYSVEWFLTNFTEIHVPNLIKTKRIFSSRNRRFFKKTGKHRRSSDTAFLHIFI